MNLRKTAVVTGAAAGIGAGIARRFAEGGYAVAIFDVDGPGATRMAAELGDQAPTLAIKGDVSNEDDVGQAVEAIIAEFERIDVLVNNAGIEVTGSVATLTSADWDRQIAVNLGGVFLMSKYSIPKMRERGGAIVNISSVHAFVSWPDCAAYDATKSGIIGLTRAMALDHGRDAIRVNAICPGYIETPLMERWLASLPNREETLAQLQDVHPLGRLGTPHDVAEAAFFLASDAASFISGTYLIVDGAMTAAGH
ncbi:MAG: SDR family NAD(P)-dependent oxidoreductase [Bryobacteraceae bacterium]